MIVTRVAALMLGAAGCAGALAAELISSSPEGARVYFITPEDGAVVSPTFTVKFGLQGMGVAPAGIAAANTGHHHLLINHEGGVNLTEPLPATDYIRHFGGGQTETEVTLAPGTYRLQLMLGNYLHIPHDPPVASEVITVTVAE